MGVLRRLATWFGWGRFAALLLLLGFVQLRASDNIFLESILLRTFDLYQWLSPRQSAERPVMIIDIDEASIAEYGQWPWPRTRVAELVENARKNGAVALGFDITFPEPDRLNPDRLADTLPVLDEPVRAALRRAPSNDEVLAEAVRKMPVVVGQSGARKRPDGAASSEDLPFTSFATLGGDPRPLLKSFPDAIRNVPLLEKAAAGRGLFSLTPEFGGTIRRVPLVQNVAGRLTPALSLELLRIASAADTIIVRSNPLGVERLIVGQTTIPTDGRARFWVRYAQHDRSKYISAKDVIENTPSAQQLKGKLVLVGTSAVGLFDLKATPVHPAMPGVEIHGQVLENVLEGTHLSRPANAIGAEVLLALVVGLLVIIFVPILGALRVFVLGAALAAAMAALSWQAFKVYGLLVDVAYPLISSFVVFLALVFINYFREESERRQIRGAFSQYLSPAMVEQLAEDPSKLVLGGETRNITLLFSDIRGFTALSETYLDNPQGLTALINRMLTPLSKAIMETRGTIDKYIGDAIVAFWNAPLDDADHAEHACASALIMLDRLAAFNGERQREADADGRSVEPLRIGIGINTGDCVVGNMGSEARFDYSVLGDSVNLCARLEGQSKTYGLPIIVGPNTAGLVGDKFAFLEVDKIRVAGRSEPTTVYTLLGDHLVRRSVHFRTMSEHMQQLLSAFRELDLGAARRALKACRDANQTFGLEPLFTLYERRISAFEKNPPSPDWGGVVDMEKH